MRAKLFSLMWQFIKVNGYSKSEALKLAWANLKLKAKMKMEIVRFYFRKADGTIREAWGTLANVPQCENESQSKRKLNATVQTYFDTEKGEWRCYKKANLIIL